jgi:hypothetical protein
MAKSARSQPIHQLLSMPSRRADAFYRGGREYGIGSDAAKQERKRDQTPQRTITIGKHGHENPIHGAYTTLFLTFWKKANFDLYYK